MVLAYGTREEHRIAQFRGVALFGHGAVSQWLREIAGRSNGVKRVDDYTRPRDQRFWELGRIRLECSDRVDVRTGQNVVIVEDGRPRGGGGHDHLGAA